MPLPGSERNATMAKVTVKKRRTVLEFVTVGKVTKHFFQVQTRVADGMQ